MKKLTRVLILVMALFMLLPTTLSALTPYKTYTYSIDKDFLDSPHAYVPEVRVNASYMGLTKDLANPQDIEADAEGKMYITDTGNSRIIVTDKYYKAVKEITTFVNEYGVDDKLKDPASTFVVNEGESRGLYVCDKGNKRLVVFDLDTFAFIREIGKPDSEIYGKDADYTPISCVVDKYGRIYVVSDTTTAGIIVMTNEGKFINFIGAPKVAMTTFDAIRKLISPKAKELITYVPTAFSSIDIDSINQEFVYATVIFATEDEQDAQLLQIESKDSDTSPVRLLNAKGADIMSRNGFFAPAGEVLMNNKHVKSELTADVPEGVSSIIDISSGPNGVWSIIDAKRSKIYTYDLDGNLLYIFGDMGSQLGNITKAKAITYQGSNIAVLDVSSLSFTVYRPTEYAEILNEAIYYQNKREYDKAVEYWRQVLARNNNFDTAYVAIGKALYRQGEYKESLEYYKNAYDTENYAIAFKEVRKEAMQKWLILVILLIVAIIVGISQLFKYAGKVNKNAQLKTGKKSFKEEFFYGFHVMFHPFDGYWDIKHEKRGSVRAGLVYIAITIVAFYYQSIGTGYYSNPRGEYMSPFSQIMAIVIPLGLFILANWCFTTLFDGEGSLKDIFIAASYALFPVPLLVIASTILTNVLVGDEVQIATILVTIAYIWMGFLLILGMQVTHDYSMGKNIVTIIATIVGMVFIMFIAMLFVTLITKMTTFVSTIASEISYR